MQVCRCAGSRSETLALKIPTRRFLPHDAAKGCQTKTDGEDEGRTRYSANTLAQCIFGRYGCRLNRRQVRTVTGEGNGEMGSLRIAGEVGNRGSMHYGDSIVIGLAAVFQDPRVYLREFIFGNALLLFRVRGREVI